MKPQMFALQLNSNGEILNSTYDFISTDKKKDLEQGWIWPGLEISTADTDVTVSYWQFYKSGWILWYRYYDNSEGTDAVGTDWTTTAGAVRLLKRLGAWKKEGR